jgi:hypothetical protein
MPPQKSVAGVAAAALLKICANQVAYAGHPPEVLQESQFRHSLGAPQIRLPMRATPPTCGRSFTFGIPQELRRPVGLYGPPPSVAGVTVSALLKCCANQVSCAGHSPPKRNSVAGVALSALLRSCANQVAYAGPPPQIWQASHCRHSSGAAQTNLPTQ